MTIFSFKNVLFKRALGFSSGVCFLVFSQLPGIAAAQNPSPCASGMCPVPGSNVQANSNSYEVPHQGPYQPQDTGPYPLLDTGPYPPPDTGPYPYVEPYPCPGLTFVESPPNNDCRMSTATVVAGATVIALIGGVTYAILGSSCGRNHHGSCYSSSNDYSGYSHHNNHHHHHHHNSDHHSNKHRRSHFPSSYYTGSHSSGIKEDMFIDGPQGPERVIVAARNNLKKQAAKEAKEISGLFFSQPCYSGNGQGSMTAFVHLPNGTTESLGTIPLTTSSGSSISFGPYKKKGMYSFGIAIEDTGTHSSQYKAGSVELKVNGSTVEMHDFFAPANAPTNYEPCPCGFVLE